MFSSCPANSEWDPSRTDGGHIAAVRLGVNRARQLFDRRFGSVSQWCRVWPRLHRSRLTAWRFSPPAAVLSPALPVFLTSALLLEGLPGSLHLLLKLGPRAFDIGPCLIHGRMHL